MTWMGGPSVMRVPGMLSPLSNSCRPIRRGLSGVTLVVESALPSMGGREIWLARRGTMRAAVAIAHKILVAAYHMLAKRSDYRELGADYLDQLSHRRTTNQLTLRLRALGYDVQLTPKAA
jgi:hypothetical protein